MIGEGVFRTQLNTIEHLLDHLGMLAERQSFPNEDIGAADLRGKSYRQIYEFCVREFAYDFRLVDQSLLRFVKGGNDVHKGSLSYSYVECPVKILPYSEFVAEFLGLDGTEDDYNENLAAVADELRSEYEEYAGSLDSKHVVTPVRYDYRASDYVAGRHPASHVHFGFGNEIRVATRKIMKPLSFFLFVVRQVYPSDWIELQQHADVATYCRNVREDLELVDDLYISPIDDREIALH